MVIKKPDSQRMPNGKERRQIVACRIRSNRERSETENGYAPRPLLLQAKRRVQSVKKGTFCFLLLSCLVGITLLFCQNLPPSRFRSVITYVHSGGNGRIAIKLLEPVSPRYNTGTGIVLTVGGFFTPGSTTDFHFDLPIEREGIVSASFLWPGSRARIDQVESEGVFDYGGPLCIQALSDVVLFLTGNKTDVNGKTVQQVLSTPVDVENAGLYAFSHPGIAVVQLFAHHPESAKYVSFFVGGENPTTDELIAVEVGHYIQKKPENIPVYNPFYDYPQDYGLNDLRFDYSNIRYHLVQGIPYYDVDQNRSFGSGDIPFESRKPTLFGKVVYSVNLLTGLLANGSLRRDTWPETWATPEEAEAWWKDRSTAFQFELIANHDYETKVMLVFGLDDHVQTAKDKPHIHHMYDGFFSIAEFPWVRLNPDVSYLEALVKRKIGSYTEHPSNTEPVDWLKIGEWAVQPPVIVSAGALAAVLEMADRTHFEDWSSNLNRVLK